MAILLDTQCVIWLVAEPERLGATARSLLRSDDDVCWSSISMVEIEIKVALGKLQVPEGLGDEVSSAGVREVGFTHQDAEAIGRLPALVAHDPFDRMLLAQALCRGIPLMTADRVLLRVHPELVIDARS